jgi:hypothetical protein
MKTTLDLPDDLVREVKLHALDQGQKLKEAVAALLRKGLAAGAGADNLGRGEEALTRRRQEVAEKFISGAWGAELADYEAGRAADRKSAGEKARRWRK